MQHTPDRFFASGALDRATAQHTLEDALARADDGKLYLEYCASESLSFDDGQLKQASADKSQGFGLRAVRGESAAYAHSAELSDAALKRAAATVKAVDAGQPAIRTAMVPAFGANHALYTGENPLDAVPFATKLDLLQRIDAYLRGRDPRVRQVSATLAGSWKLVHILRADGRAATDIRPLVRLSVQVVVEAGGRMESGSGGAGGRYLYAALLEPRQWQSLADDALRQALVNLDARPAPAGELPGSAGRGLVRGLVARSRGARVRG